MDYRLLPDPRDGRCQVKGCDGLLASLGLCLCVHGGVGVGEGFVFQTGLAM